jgi:hypothetical protein
MSGLKVTTVLDALASHAQTLGFFEQVLTHEPKSAPTSTTYVVFLDQVVPFKERSGLSSVSAVVMFMGRIYLDFIQQPEDNIDRDMLMALDALMVQYIGDLDLGDSEVELDVLGQYTTGLISKAGYIKHDNTLYRVIDISLPVIVNDVWTEAH